MYFLVHFAAYSVYSPSMGRSSSVEKNFACGTNYWSSVDPHWQLSGVARAPLDFSHA